jgi:alpha-glucosidase
MSVLKKDPNWWRGAVIYQIYPRSFQDSNGDGVGDLAGITARLPYVAALGVDAIWISPFFTSPMKDFGYDVADYRGVDPLFGTLDDFDRLLEVAHALGLKVMIDLVLSHTSDQHPWFRESRSDRSNARADWYVWADPKPDGTAPNNWLSVFGGSAWQWEPRREQYYLHNFLSAQPDLNFHSDAVQAALLDVARFWLERGVDGFRLDTINFYMHDNMLRDNPPLPPEERNDHTAPKVNPYNHQRHIYDKNHPQNIEFLRKLRRIIDPYKAAAVGEIGDSQRGLEILGEYTSGEDAVHMSYAFELLSGHEPLPAAFIAEVFRKVAQVAPEGWACWACSNHDVMRHVSRWSLTDRAARCYATLLMCLRGSVCLYQGEELGLPEAEIAYEDLRDPYGIEFWPEFKGRDGARTPMVWSGSEPHAGFSVAWPWLPIPQSHLALAVDRAEAEPASLLQHYRRVIYLRHAHGALARGLMTQVAVEGSVLQFIRDDGHETLLCVFNLAESKAQVALPTCGWEPVAGLDETAEIESAALVMEPWSAVILKPVDLIKIT